MEMANKISEEDLEKITAAFKQGNYNGTLEQLQVALDTFDNFKMDIAFTGYSGAGKSSLINALRDLRPEDKEAAPTGVVETTMTPAMYQDSRHPDVRLWDLPGLGTPSFTAQSYVENMNFDLFDMFIIVASERMKENNVYLVDEILKRQKSFYFVRSKVDNDLRAESKKRNFSKSRVLERMRKECVTSLETRMKDPQVFLISACETKRHDFEDLRNTLDDSLPELKKKAFSLFLTNLSTELWGISSLLKKSIVPHSVQSGKIREEDLGRIKAAFRRSDLSDGAPKVQSVLSALERFRLDVAVVGGRRSGTSSFVNALMGLRNTDRDAAPTGAAGTTKEPTAYPHPGDPLLQLWDVPIMEEDLSDPRDLATEEINRYDFYLITVSDWPTPFHFRLSQTVAGLNKRCYFVQLRVDRHVHAHEGLYGPDLDALERIRDHCAQELQKAGVLDPQIFLVSSFHWDLYDFINLEIALREDLPTLRKQAFILYATKILRQKQEERSCRIL
ncbi:hypothetical protein JZ751_007450 [Albula glossodonta]|uniref:IRG-type G domain-containing protein n=1 Tax=Albula glossodonta TaxID=121402 RepID=A0A8T2NDS5_9TELE|nr:hypothetical protein JZ751_007450 [Albula glossodonta]